MKALIESTPLINLIDVSKTYGDKCILNAYTKPFYKGSLTILKGKNGSGKTTLLKICMNKISIDDGKVEIQKGLKYRYMPDFVELPYADLALNFIRWMLSIMKVPLDVTFLDALHIDLGVEVEKLSKGNKQKLLLYLALVGQPDVVFLDEPFTGLDKKSIEVVKKRIQTMVKSGCCILISTHQAINIKDSQTEVIDFDEIVHISNHKAA